jgi:hypothetical protein
MRFGFALLLLSLAPAWSQAAKPAAAFTAPGLPAAKAPRIPAQTITGLERTFDNRLLTMADINEPMDLLGDTRGVQLDDYGVVFTTEVSLVRTPGLMPGRPKIPPEMAAHIRTLKVARLPLLKAAMMEMMGNMATAFSRIPASHQLVLVVRLWYAPWEDTTGMPSQVLMKASRAAVAAARVETEER